MEEIKPQVFLGYITQYRALDEGTVSFKIHYLENIDTYVLAIISLANPSEIY